ncbi:ArsR/SmtB family transcription factor [Clostridium sp.]|uniref:ArsR/SmtB family transcription factor n=1 Tax=Clostridium sp. TaxID=1506 RepID=UPI003D6D8811
MQKSKILSTIEQVKAISDPYKIRILNTLDVMNVPATVKQIADSLEQVPAKVYYHVKKMEKLGILELIYTKEINGIIAKYYSATAENFEVKCDDDIDDGYKSVMLGETQRMVAELYKSSKNIFLEQMNHIANNDKKTDRRLTTTDLYFTEEQEKEFCKYIEEFVTKHKIKTSADQNKYHGFMSFIKFNATDDDKKAKSNLK